VEECKPLMAGKLRKAVHLFKTAALRTAFQGWVAGFRERREQTTGVRKILNKIFNRCVTQAFERWNTMVVGPGGCCSPRQRMPFLSQEMKALNAVDDVSTNICQTLDGG